MFLNFNLPEFIVFRSVNIPTLSIFFILGVLFSLFYFWEEIKKDGFDEEYSFDLYFLSLFSFYLVSKVSYSLLNLQKFKEIISNLVHFWVLDYNLILGVFSLILIVIFLCKKNKWSFFRIADILSLTLFFGILPVIFSYSLILKSPLYFFIASVLLLINLVLIRLRSSILSGSIYCFSLVFLGFFMLFLKFNLLNLIFFIILITISLLSIYLRLMSGSMQISSKEFILKIATKLKLKEKELVKEEIDLVSENPSFSPNRTEDNEYLDDVSEGVEQQIYDEKVKLIKKATIQVRKALARIKLGKYGICEVCNKPISSERLKAYPEATTCVEHSS